MEESYKLPELDYKVLSSGSNGNAVRIEDIMVDCGIAYSRMKKELNKCRLLFITHIHSDHLNIKTLNKIKENHKQIKVVGNYQVAEKVGVDIISAKKEIKSKDWKIKPFEVLHDVLVQGITIQFKNGTDVIYVTDSAGTDGWPKGEFDYLFIESNYNENVIKQVDKSKYKYDYIGAAKRHTSYQESKAYYYMHRKGKESEWIELHKSKRFY